MGIDIGTGSSKGVLLKGAAIIADGRAPSGVNYKAAAEKVISSLLEKAGVFIADVKYTVATGYGAASVPGAQESVADIRCCAKGVYYLLPNARTIIDIEGQTTQVIRLGNNWQIANFATSEKCASGSGRFIEILSNVLQVPIEDIGALSMKSKRPVTFTTACAVFGESEAVSRVAEGFSAADILAGVHKAMAEKIATMIERTGMEESVAVCGGGALNSGLVKALENALKVSLVTIDKPDMVTALGAALIASGTLI